jgi:hypothetical protein
MTMTTRKRHSPAYAEPWISTIRRGCRDRLMIFSERQIVTMLADTDVPPE